jgi:hypothetical protein
MLSKLLNRVIQLRIGKYVEEETLTSAPII